MRRHVLAGSALLASVLSTGGALAQGDEFPQVPADAEHPDPSLPAGTIEVEIHDGQDKPLANESVTLGILVNSVAKGESHKHEQGLTDGSGRVRFPALETAGNIAYRVSCGHEGGSFAAMPFQLPKAGGMRVVLHVYPVARDLAGAVVVVEATLAAELRDDRIQIEEALVVYNLGKTAWQPDDVGMTLPDGFTAFGAQKTMSDQGVDEAQGAARLRGTFAPGRSPVEFRYQLPWSGEQEVAFDVALPPHIAIARVVMPATSDVKLTVAGFPRATPRRDDQGQSMLITERQLRPDEAPLRSLSIQLDGLPSPGSGRLVAVALATVAVLAGLAYSLSVARRSGHGPATGAYAEELDAERDRHLRELLDLERARETGAIGPKTYERARRELLDSLARCLHGSA